MWNLVQNGMRYEQKLINLSTLQPFNLSTYQPINFSSRCMQRLYRF